MTAKTAFILDGYVDEPACLGVSPYISPYVRYTAGVFIENGYEVSYLTIDQLREDPFQMNRIEKSDVFLFIAGVTVPGKYLGGVPASPAEIHQTASSLKHPLKCLAGPVLFGSASQGGRAAESDNFGAYDYILGGECSAALEYVLKSGNSESEAERGGCRVITGELDYAAIDRRSAAGAGIIRNHPAFPHVVCELETARGCSRAAAGGCSFCTEYMYGLPNYRSEAGIAAEVKALYENGALYFRLGRQPDLLAYGSARNNGIAKPVPETVESLYRSIRDSAPNLRVLHADNINPATIAAYPEESAEALRAIVKYHTAGDTAAFGLESADPEVVRANNLKAFSDDVFEAVRIVNEIGRGRDKYGVPHLLPGINFVSGLAGETETTYDLNEAFLKKILSEDLMVRRVNIRQVMPFPGTAAYSENTLGKYDTRFRKFKENVRNGFDLPMLKKVFPRGTVLDDAVVEVSGSVSFARQLGSYPILIGIPFEVPKGTAGSFFVTDWGFRSITALPNPFHINTAPHAVLKKLPGLGKKAAGDLFVKRPFADKKSVEKVCGKQFFTEFLDFTE